MSLRREGHLGTERNWQWVLSILPYISASSPFRELILLRGRGCPVQGHTPSLGTALGHSLPGYQSLIPGGEPGQRAWNPNWLEAMPGNPRLGSRKCFLFPLG